MDLLLNPSATAPDPVTIANAAEVAAGDLFAEQAARSERIAMYKQLALAGMLILASAAYAFRLKKARYIIGSISIVIVGCWLKVTPGTADFLRLFKVAEYQHAGRLPMTR